MPLSDGAQVMLVYALDHKIIINRLWFVTRQPPIDQIQLDALALGVANHFETQLLPSLSSELGFSRVEAHDWTADPAPFIAFQNVFATGGGSADCHSANVAIRAVFKGDSSQTFPNNSNFVGGIPKDQVTLNRYSDTIKDAIFECYANLIDAAVLFGTFPAWTWVITSRQLNNSWRPTQDTARMDFVRFPSPFTSPRRKRIPT